MDSSQAFDEFEKNSEWFYGNINKLREESLTGKFVAIKDERPIAFDKDINKVVEILESKGEDSQFMFIEFVYPEGTTILF
ncbi:MAG: hypothetical protein KKF50_05615 [Nanoarchaeota archaeon]|nr:hypothetical protein [Nanoarchaeota archaeon]